MELVSARELASLVVRSLGMDDVDPDQIDLDAPLFGEGLGLDSLDMLLLLTIAVIVVNLRLQNSRLGRAWEAIREDEVAAKAMGINTRNVKLLAFAMGASFGGIAGAVFSATQQFISPESFGLFESIIVLAMVVLGGMGDIPGVILGAVLLTLLPEVLRYTMEPLQMGLFGRVLIDAETIRLLVFGIALVAIMLFRPAGLWPSAVRKRELEVRKAAA